jgi:hypothetical protein
MNAIPFNVPGLPETDQLASQFVLKPIIVDTTDLQAGPRLGLSTAAKGSLPDPQSDGVLCIYPGIETISYLFNGSFRSGQKDILPAIVVNTHATEGICTIFAFSSDLNGNPMLVVNILPDEYLPKVFTSHDGSPVIDLSGVDDRLEVTQIFTANSFGVISRISNDLTKTPKEDGNAVFKLYDDSESIADVCSFYMSRALTLAEDNPASPGGIPSAGLGDPLYALLWKATSAKCIAAFAAVFILTRLSISIRRARGQTTFSLDYNRGANRPDRGGNPNAN